MSVNSALGMNCLMVVAATSMKFKGVMVGQRYVKEVDASERTIKFYQEIYDEKDQLVEIHEKYPVNKGHSRVQGGK